MPVREQFRNQFRRVLEIAVHQDHGVPVGVMQAGAQRDLMAEIANQSDIADAAIGCREPLDFRQGAVGGAVIDEYDLPIGQ